MDVRCIVREKDVARLEVLIDTMRNLKIRSPHCRTRRFNILDFINRIFLGTYNSPNWMLLRWFGCVIDDADEKDKPVAVEKKYVAHIFFKRSGQGQVSKVPRFFKTRSGKINIQSPSRRAVRSIGSQKPRHEYSFAGIVRAMSHFSQNSSGFVATSNQFHASLDVAAGFFKGFGQQALGGCLRKRQDEWIFMMHLTLEENLARPLAALRKTNPPNRHAECQHFLSDAG